MSQTDHKIPRQLLADPATIFVLLATMLVIGLLINAFDPLYLYNDAFQHVSAARSLATGEGYSTSIIYYEQNYVQQTMPAPQTVWPPGIAAMASLLVLAGVHPVSAVSAVSMFGLLLCPLILLRIGAQLGFTMAMRLTVAVSPIALGLLVYITLRAGTEGPFIAATLVALLGACLLASETKYKGVALTLIAVGTTMAVSIRYNGLFLIVSTGLWFLLGAIMTRSLSPIIHGIISLLPATALGIAILFRNLGYTGSLTGGPVSESWAAPTEVIRALVEAVISTIGFDPSKSGQLVLLVLLLVAVTLTLIRLIQFFLKTPLRKGHLTCHTNVLIFCLLYLIVSILMLLLVLAPRALNALGYRYLIPLVPFCVLVAGIVWHRAGNPEFRQPVFYAMCGVLLIGNGLAFVSDRHALIEDNSLVDVTGSLSLELPDGQSLQELIGSSVSRSSPVLSSSSQRLGGLTGWPVLGLTSGMYSLSEWHEEEAHVVVQRYGVCYVLLHDRDTESHMGGGRAFFTDLREGTIPTWLEQLVNSPSLKVYAVNECRSNSSNG